MNVSPKRYIDRQCDISTWWLNQPHLKKYARQNGFIFPQFYSIIFKKPPPRYEEIINPTSPTCPNLGPNRASPTANKSPNKSSTEVSAGAWPGKKSFNKKRLEAQHNGAPRCWWLNQPIWKICSSSWIISSNRFFLVPPPSPLCCPKTPNSSYQISSNDLPIFLVAWTSIYWCFVLFQ